MDDSEAQSRAISERAVKWLEKVIALIGGYAAAFVCDGENHVWRIAIVRRDRNEQPSTVLHRAEAIGR